MKLLVLGHDEVTALLPVGECIPVMRDALVSLAEMQRLYLLDGRLRTVLDADELKEPPPRTRDPLK